MSEETPSISVTYSRSIQPAPYENITASVTFFGPGLKTEKQGEKLMGQSRSIVEGQFGLKLGAAAAAEDTGKYVAPPTEPQKDARTTSKVSIDPDPTEEYSSDEIAAAAGAKDPEPESEPEPDLDLGESPAPEVKEISAAKFKEFLVAAMQKVPGTKIAAAFQKQFETRSAGDIKPADRAKAVDLVKAILKEG